MLTPADVFGICGGGLGGALLTISANLFMNRGKPRTDAQLGDAAQIQALLASATYWEGQYKRSQGEATAWQKEASDWHERFFRLGTDQKVTDQAVRNLHQLVADQVQATRAKDAL